MSRRWPASLITRTALLSGLAACLITGSLGGYLFQSARRSIEENTDRLLVARVEHFRRVVADMPSIADFAGRPVLFESMLGAERDVLLFQRAGDAPFIRVNPAGLPVPELAATPFGRITGMADVTRTSPPDGVPVHWVAAVTRTAAGGEPITVIAGHPMYREIGMLEAYGERVILATLGGMLVSALLAFLLLRGGLRPLGRLAARAGEINPITLAVRFDETRLPSELRAMTGAFNAMLERIAAGYQRLNQFSADLAHEIRTPLGALIGQTQVTLGQPRQPAEYRDVLASNLEEFGRLRAITENILFLARIEHTEREIERSPIDLDAELRKIADYFDGLADERSMRFEVSAAGAAWANPQLCQRAVNNLVINAVRYGREGTTVRLIGRQDACGASIIVENRGVPIPDDQRDRLFDRFYRGDAARSRPTESNGLGLAIVKTIMTLHGGTAGVACREPDLIRFELRFPAGLAGNYRECARSAQGVGA
ncbi:heavy metal sensor histidine kinase [Telmatospirillum siberiense]|uniref:Sensor protein n=1 Tax=Telmatospirillum siberiense TaxID=382514 RepID=A0A2N3PZ36_9PROT|nr:heavy metal sensor histidine kinase [Telmatospirillum siberiense]PKU25658.1 two-component sensor histidine kinase [Telmatospirillum siberiense]